MGTISTSLDAHLNAFSRPTSNYEIGSAKSLKKSTYIVDFAPVSSTSRYARDPGEAGKEPPSKGVNRISRGPPVPVDLATARSERKVEETLYRYYIWNAHPLQRQCCLALSSLGIGEPSLERDFSYI
jgi:hypothetical protein